MTIHLPFLRCVAAVAMWAIALTAAASGRPLGERAMRNTPYEIQQLRMAFAGGRFLTAWVETRGDYGSAIMGSLSDVAGNAISTEPFVITSLSHPFIYHFQLVGTGDSFALFYQLSSANYMVRVSAEGHLLTQRWLSGSVQDYACQAWNGRQFACTGRSGVFAPVPVIAFLDASGNHVTSPKSIGTNWEATPDLVTAHGRFFAVSTREGLSIAPISKDGYGTRTRLSDDRYASVTTAEAADDALLAVWTTPENGVLQSIIVRNDGTASPVSFLSTNPETSIPIALMTRPEGGFTLLYVRGGHGDRHEVRLLSLDADGRPAGEEKLIVLLEPSETGGYFAAASGNGTFALHANLPGITGPTLMIVGADGQTSASRVLALALEAQSAPVLGSGDGRAVALLTQRSGRMTRTLAGHVDGGGAVTWAEVPAHEYRSAALPWNGSEFLFLHYDQETLYGTLLSNDGLALGEPFRIGEMRTDSPEIEARPAAVWAGDRWVVVWPRESLNFSMTTITRDRTISPAREMIPPIPLPWDYWRWHLALALAWNGEDVLLAWAQYQPPPCMQPLCDQGPLETYASRITRTGEFVDSPLKLSSVGLEVYEFDSLSIATSGHEFLVAAGASISVVDSVEGRLSLVHTESLSTHGVASDAAWDGRDYVVAYRQEISRSESRLVIARLDRGGRILREIEANIGAAASYRNAAPSIAPLWPGEVLVGVQEGSFTNGAGAYVYRESDLAPHETIRRRAVRR